MAVNGTAADQLVGGVLSVNERGIRIVAND